MAEDKKNTYSLNNSWVLWYHNPINNDWSTSSYKKVYEFNDIQSFWKLFNTWEKYLPSLDKSMFFLMRKRDDDEYIYPMWEDTNNKKGGCFSFRVDKEHINEVWLKLCAYLTGTHICKPDDYMNITGISSSPKRNFCILKIWNNDSNYANIDYLNSELSEIIDLDKYIYKSHLENISKDQKKKEKRERIEKNTTFYKRSNRSNKNRGKNYGKDDTRREKIGSGGFRKQGNSGYGKDDTKREKIGSGGFRKQGYNGYKKSKW